MPTTQQEKIAQFRSLHAGPGAFVMPNPWDVGSARMLAHIGFPALATSSSASAATLGRRDYHVSRDEALAMARAIVEATEIPVSADLEDGFGASVDDVLATARGASAAGLAGFSIEDAAGNAAPYELSLATDRIAAVVDLLKTSPVRPVLTARAENFLRGKPDLDDTIRRLQAFEKAGADVLFAPALPSLEAIRTVCSAVTKPVSVIGYVNNGTHSVAELAAAGAKRISLATVLYRAAMAAARDAALDLRRHGTFSFAATTLKPAELNAWLE